MRFVSHLMIVISIIFAVIGSFIYALVRFVNVVDEKLAILSMERQSKLSLNRDRCHQSHMITNDVPVEISDDESFDLNPQANMEFTSTTHGAAYTSNDTIDNLPPFSLKGAHDLSDDLSSDEDVDVDTIVPSTSKKTQSMFNWGETSFTSASMKYQSSMSSVNILHDSRFEKEESKELANKKQKVVDLTYSSDEEFVSFEIPKKEASPPEVTIQHDIMIAGTKVTFPVKPYSCQIAVMNSLIKGCTKEEHCLLESPTGSGKTLALLCGALAWQGQYREKMEKMSRDESSKTNAEGCCGDEKCLDDNFFLNSSQYFDEEWCEKVLRTAKARKVPKIYYGTRTHKQIKQIVKELNKTAYRNKRMTILSARNHTCIQVSNKNKNELCNELNDQLKGKQCPYYSEHSKKRMTLFKQLEGPWDIEDLVTMGKDIKTCPYFGARSLMEDAEIIFCPYNYIVDPNIRESMQINLKGDIVILDEAHNIEDTCREAASVILRNDELRIAAHDCKELVKLHNRNFYEIIQKYLTDIADFIENHIDVKQNGNEIISDCWLGSNFLALLDINNVGRLRFFDFHEASKDAIQHYELMKQEIYPKKIVRTITQDTKKILEYLCFAIQMLTSDKFVNDYKVCVTENLKEPYKKALPEDDGWISTKKKKKPVRLMKLSCMNPAIIFAPLANTVRSVIVASGTLTPITSFQSELGTKFPHIVNPDHIISKEQVYVRCIPRGPNGKTLIANYENVNSFTFQDELGSLILQVCDAVPYGVVCFFSSYFVMNKLHERWESNGTWSKLEKLKTIFVEPKDNRDLDEIMTEYDAVIKESSSKSFREASGAIFFAVFRGKVAEGMNFSDNKARCVLTVGIPYRSKNDVTMKMDYNNSNRSKGYLSGREWYTVDAFRALNQALGRGIRHKNDWSAVLMVDDRLRNPNNINYLPKWIKKRLQNENYDLQTELEDFVAIQVARERGEQCVAAV